MTASDDPASAEPQDSQKDESADQEHVQTKERVIRSIITHWRENMFSFTPVRIEHSIRYADL